MKRIVLLAFVLSGCTTSGDDTTGGPICGDGVVDAGEQCDDGNAVNGDGCSSACTTETPRTDAYISATWQLKNIVTNTTTACPQGFDTAALYSQPVNSSGAPTGAVIVDLFNCSASTGTSAPLPPGLYQVWIEIANHDNTSKYATSLSAYVDVTTSDKTFSAEILNDGGYFQLAWTLRGANTNNQLTCAQAGAAGGLEAIGTDVSNSSNSASDIFDCEDGAGVTAGYSAATYTISVAALNAANQSIGTAPTLTNKVIGTKNAVTNLGTITVPITGQ
jgi:cysteine-rich repeat protein